jgi:formamidopyrimidine-DNA glycosylase
VPELPEVETVRRGLNDVTLHQTIQGGDVLLDRTIAHPFSVPAFLMGLKGTAIVQWHRRGKYLLAELEPSAGQRSAVSRQQIWNFCTTVSSDRCFSLRHLFNLPLPSLLTPHSSPLLARCPPPHDGAAPLGRPN